MSDQLVHLKQKAEELMLVICEEDEGTGVLLPLRDNIVSFRDTIVYTMDIDLKCKEMVRDQNAKVQELQLSKKKRFNYNKISWHLLQTLR